MSSEEAATQNGSLPDAASVPELDVSKLHSLPTEQQDLFLLTFVSDFRLAVRRLGAEALPTKQALIKKEAIKIVGLASPVPSRPVRISLAKTLADSFNRGSRQLLYEAVNELLGILNAGKVDKGVGPKHASVVCLGEIFHAAGDSAVSLSGLTVQSLIKVLKASHVGLRGSIFRSLSQLIEGVGASIDENVARDIWKAARSAGSGEKAALVQKYAFHALRSLCTLTTYFNNSSDFENLQSTSWKALESPVAGVRHAVARTLASAFAAAYSDSGASDVPVIRKPRKSKKQGDPDEEEEVERSGTPGPGQSKPTVQLSMGIDEIIKLLSRHFIKSSTSSRGRSGLALALKYTLQQLPQRVLEDRFGRIAELLFNELLDHPSMDFTRYRYLLARILVKRVLESIVKSHYLTENAQINATRFLINDVIKNYPKLVAERRTPSKRVLIGALDLLDSLLQRLGSAASVLQDSCREALCRVMQHPSYTVQSHAAQALKTFGLCCPSQLMRTIQELLAQLRKALDSAENRVASRISGGYALAVAALIHSANAKPLFGSVQIYSELFSFATELLKASATSQLRQSATQVQVAWTIIGGLMNLGPSFIKVHLNQLLLLWRNALPPPLTPDNAAQRNQLELSFLCHVRECALSGLLAFFDACSALITTDGSRRISMMLQNTVNFLQNLPNTRHTEDVSHRLVPALQTQDMALMLRRRLLQCFCALFNQRNIDLNDALARSDLVGLTTRIFTSPERPTTKSLEASLASSASNFEGIWESNDNWGYGISGLMRHDDIHYPDLKGFRKVPGTMMSTEEIDIPLDELSQMPILSAIEHDPATLYRPGSTSDPVELGTSSTACIDQAIKLFSIVFPLQSMRVQEGSLEQLATILAQPMQRDPGKKAAVQFNATLAILSALAIANGQTPFTRGSIHMQTVGKLILELCRNSINEQDTPLRGVGAQAIGLACNLGDSQFTNNEVKALIDLIVANRDPNMRAGCALALGRIHSEVGAMASSLHIKSIVGVLLSLCNDSHPVVHFWALQGLNLVAESAGLSFSSFATSTLGMLAQLYSNDSHNSESASLATSNLELEYSTTLGIAQAVDSIINVNGPDLQDLSKPRNMILTLTAYFKGEESIALQYLSFVCLGHFSMYAPAHLQFSSYVLDLQRNLSSPHFLLNGIAIRGINDLMKRSASEVARVATTSLDDDIWKKLDEDPENTALHAILRSWMQQTVIDGPGEWIDRCQTILSRTRAKDLPRRATTMNVKTAVTDLADEEVAGFAAAAQGEVAEPSVEGQEFLRWQTRDFAMRILSEGLQTIQDTMLPDQVTPAEEELHTKVADIIRVAFSASTAGVIELRIWGLRIIDQVLKMFGKTPDPDFLEASLLEQYQAQIGSALTPAFAADSSPDLAAEAIAVCATFVATGIVTTADRMGRLFKVLATGIENLSQAEPEAAVGDLKNLTSTAQSMLKMSLLSGWAQLQLASEEQAYLDDIVQPFIPKLAPLWLSALQEFARLRFEPEISDTLGIDTLNPNLDERYAAFNRVVRLEYYQSNWLSIVNAIAVLVDKDSDAVFDALDKKQATPAKINGVNSGKDMSFREEPVAFFYILFGLAFEAIVTRAREDLASSNSILQALRKILTPAVSGNAVYDEAVFNETTDTLDRLALTSTTQTQSVLVDIARNLSLHHPSAKDVKDRDEKLSDDIEQLFELTRIMILVMTGMIATLEDPPGSAVRRLPPESVALVQMAFEALVEVSEVFPSVIRTDLHACVLHCYCTILATGVCQGEVVPSLLPLFRSFLQSITEKAGEVTGQLIRGCLHQMLVVLSIAQRRENEFSMACAKNTLLSVTILLTSAGTVIAANDQLVRKAIEEILDCLRDVGLAKVAAGCVRTLLIAKPKSTSECHDGLARMLWPRIVTFVCDEDDDADPEGISSALVQALVGSVGVMAVKRRQAAMAILVPVLLLRAEQVIEGQDIKKEIAGRLLELAGLSQQGFRDTVGMLDEEKRSELESLLRTAGVGRRSGREVEGEEDEESRPTIELRMDF
jgi:HEAT repeat-containing protein 5